MILKCPIWRLTPLSPVMHSAAWKPSYSKALIPQIKKKSESCFPLQSAQNIPLSAAVRRWHSRASLPEERCYLSLPKWKSSSWPSLCYGGDVFDCTCSFSFFFNNFFSFFMVFQALSIMLWNLSLHRHLSMAGFHKIKDISEISIKCFLVFLL